MNKKVIIGILIIFLGALFVVLKIVIPNKNLLTLSVDINENGTYYSENFKVSNERNVTIYSNMDCSIEIVNVENEEDSKSIGYLTQGMHEHFKLSKEKTYRIKVNKEVKGLNISITDAFKE